MAMIEVEKLWGSETWLENDENYCAKLLFLTEGFQSSLHFHKEKIETFICVAGKVRLEILPYYNSHPDQADVIQKRYLQPYQSATLRPYQPHRFTALTPTAVIVETSTFHSDEDVVRLEESRKIDG